MVYWKGTFVSSLSGRLKSIVKHRFGGLGGLTLTIFTLFDVFLRKVAIAITAPALKLYWR